MNSILDELSKEEVWHEYLEFKKKQASISKYEIKKLEAFIEDKKYMEIVEKIINEEYTFSIPEKHLINKVNKSKKRVVYSFNEFENYVLKVVTYLFSKRYDELYPDNCYSFRRNSCVKNAINKIVHTKDLNTLYGYKVDISNYFNSINVDIMLNKLKNFISNDKKLYSLIEGILKDKRVSFENNIIEEEKGIMAGVPISSFLANIYLMDLDKYFESNNVLYFRYSDDIIFFTSENEIELYIQILNNKIKENKLVLNEDKIIRITPGNRWDFLGFSFENRRIDISDVAKKKIKGKIKRACRKLRRWMIRKDASSDRAISAVIRKFNKKFYMIDNTTELTWCLWYFPVINTDEGLKEIDEYMQQELRFISTGKHSKKNYNVKYEKLKQLGYRPLVSEYYKFRNELINKRKIKK